MRRAPTATKQSGHAANTTTPEETRYSLTCKQHSTSTLILRQARTVSLRQVNTATRQTRHIQIMLHVRLLHQTRTSANSRPRNKVTVRLALTARHTIHSIYHVSRKHACERIQRHGSVLHHAMKPRGSDLHLVTAKPAHAISDESRVLNIRGTTLLTLP